MSTMEELNEFRSQLIEQRRHAAEQAQMNKDRLPELVQVHLAIEALNAILGPVNERPPAVDVEAITANRE